MSHYCDPCSYFNYFMLFQNTLQTYTDIFIGKISGSLPFCFSFINPIFFIFRSQYKTLDERGVFVFPVSVSQGKRQRDCSTALIRFIVFIVRFSRTKTSKAKQKQTDKVMLAKDK